MIRRPPRSKRMAPSFPTRRSSDLGGHEIGRYVKAKREAAVPHCCGDLPRRPASAAADVDHPLAGGIAGLGKKRLADRLDHALEPVELGQPACARVAGPIVRGQPALIPAGFGHRSEEHTSELQSLMRISYAVFCLKKKKKHK